MTTDGHIWALMGTNKDNDVFKNQYGSIMLRILFIISRDVNTISTTIFVTFPDIFAAWKDKISSSKEGKTTLLSLYIK